MTLRVRLATEDDAEQIQPIYAVAVSETATSFELEAPDVEETRRRVASALEKRAWLVAELGHGVAGYAYAGPHRARPAYQWSVETSIYIDSSAHRLGVGRTLYTALLSLLEVMGFYNVYAGITMPNPASVALHEKLGFTCVGTYQSIGYKFGKWHDVSWWALTLRDKVGEPEVPRALGELTEEEIDSALGKR